MNKEGFRMFSFISCFVIFFPILLILNGSFGVFVNLTQKDETFTVTEVLYQTSHYSHDEEVYIEKVILEDSDHRQFTHKFKSSRPDKLPGVSKKVQMYKMAGFLFEKPKLFWSVCKILIGIVTGIHLYNSFVKPQIGVNNG